jgi:hypothetical protein
VAKTRNKRRSTVSSRAMPQPPFQYNDCLDGDESKRRRAVMYAPGRAG